MDDSFQHGTELIYSRNSLRYLPLLLIYCLFFVNLWPLNCIKFVTVVNINYPIKRLSDYIKSQLYFGN